MGIEKGRPSEQSPKMKGIFYEAMQEKKLSESPKPLILLFFSKSSVSPLAPNKHDSFDTNVSETIVLFLFAKAPVTQGFSAQLPFGFVSL